LKGFKLFKSCLLFRLSEKTKCLSARFSLVFRITFVQIK